MDEPTVFLYGFITADAIRTRRFVERWNAAGLPAVRALALQILLGTIPDTSDIGKCQRRLMQGALSQVDWFQLGHRLSAFSKQVQEGTHAG